jgi:hypothetical protein
MSEHNTDPAMTLQAVDLQGPQGPTTAVINIRPLFDATVLVLKQEAVVLLDYAKAQVVANDEDYKVASDDLAIVKSNKKKVLEASKQWFEDVLKLIAEDKAAFKGISDPLDEARQLFEKKMKDYNAKLVELRRLQEEANRKIEEARRIEASMNYGEIKASPDLVEVVAAPPKRVRSSLATSTTIDHWTIEIVDETKLPRWALIPDVKKLSKIVNDAKGKITIEGVRIIYDPGMRSNLQGARSPQPRTIEDPQRPVIDLPFPGEEVESWKS